VIAIFGNLDIGELLVIALFAVMIFGRNLPRVAAQAVTRVAQARRALQKVWRESGIGDEIRDVQREIDVSARRLRDADPRTAIRSATRDIDARIRKPATSNEDEGTSDPDASRGEELVDEPAAERERRPGWYPDNVEPPSLEDFEAEGGIPSGPGVSPGGIMPPTPRVEPDAAPEETEEEDPPKADSTGQG
jgi:Sec-independent protein translocase protein TatA